MEKAKQRGSPDTPAYDERHRRDLLHDAVRRLEAMRLELLTALVECQDYDELYKRCMELVEDEA